MNEKHFIYYRLYWIIACAFLMACTDLTDVENDIKNLQEKVTNLEGAISSLQTAYQDGKIIKIVEAIENEEEQGWKITFSDNSSINIINGKDGINGENAITPYIQIDSDNCWSVSYDNGKTFIKLKDAEGNPIHATGEKGGKGDEGISVRITINADSFYTFETYYTSDPETVLSTIVTPYSSRKETIISSITKDSQTEIITLTMADGTIFTFNLDMIYPTSIVLLTDELLLGQNSISTFEFRINPSNAVLDLNVENNDSQISLDLITKNATRTNSVSYITPPTNYKLTKIEPAVNEKGEIKVGQYKAYIQDLNLTKGYNENIALVISTKDGVGNSIQLSSSILKISWGIKNPFLSFAINGIKATSINENTISVCMPYGTDVTALKATFNIEGAEVYIGETKQESGETINNYSNPVTYRIISKQGDEHEYIVTLCYSNLPIVYITTKDNKPVVSKDDWIKKSTMIIGNTNNKYDAVYTNISIKGRGNSTWGYPKKPYAIKLDDKAEVLGMPRHKRWVLLANWMDRTLLRNAVALEIAKNTEDLEWTPKGQFVEVVLNGEFQGNYYLCEQIKIDENRVNIVEMKPEDVSEETITGGYLLELDITFDEINKFHSKIRNLPVNIKQPDEDVLTQTQFNYIENFFNKTEAALYASDFISKGTYKDYIDLNTFIDWWFVHELTQNGEPGHPKSSYMYKDRNNKLKAGPVWDFDWGTFVPGVNKFYITQAIWYNRLFQDPDFVTLVKQKWERSKARFETIADFIDEQAKSIKTSAEANCIQWPINQTVNKDESLSFTDAVARMKKAYQDRIKWMDSAINNL